MPNAYVPLPAYRSPTNAILDFSPLNEGLDAIAKVQERNRLLDESKQISQALRSSGGAQSNKLVSGGNSDSNMPRVSSSAPQFGSSNIGAESGGNANATRKMGGAAAAPEAPATQAAASPSLNYQAAIDVALQQGRLDVANQLMTQQRQEQHSAQQRQLSDVALQRGRLDIANQFVTQRRQAQQSAQQRQLTDLNIEKMSGDLQSRAVARVAGIAQTIKAQQDPAVKSQMVERLLAVHPEMRRLFGNYGYDPNNPDPILDMIISEAQGAPLQGKDRFLVTPNGVMDVTTNQIVPGTAKPEGTAGGIKPPAGYRATAEGNLEFIPGGPADPASKPSGKFNEGQTKAANFGNMMVKANEALAQIVPEGQALENPKNVLGSVRDAIVPFEGLRNIMTPDDTQTYNQIAKQWIRAKLRKESGAAIGKDEMEQEFRTYFPQYGDGPEVLKRKAEAREEATRGMIAESGGAYGQLFPSQGKTQTVKNPFNGSPQPKTENDPLGILD